MKKLVLMRGVPGSGKSTKARELAVRHLSRYGKSLAICSTDDFHMVDDEYVFQADKLGDFHKMNQTMARQHMALGTELIVIDNTNVKRRDMKPYMDMAEKYEYDVEEVMVGRKDIFPSLEDACPHKFADYIDMCATRNTHAVPREAIEKMARNFQE